LTFAGTGHSLTFTSVMPQPSGGFPAQRADVELVVDGTHRLVLRWTSHLHAIRVGPSPRAVTTEILDGVERLDLSYWPTPRGGWTSIWRDAAPPRLVRIQIVFSDPNHQRWPDILVAPMMDSP
jgi:hypothetical protein